jgi:AraC family transcriptional regulator, regulatory protein of adaptative response / methylated-DNA-[protein]-cysteine methyltransferase
MLVLSSDIGRQEILTPPAENIRFALENTSLGRTAVAFSDTGVCLVAFADTDADLIAEIHARFPTANVTAATEDAGGLVARTLDLIEARDASTSPPRDLRGTPFQLTVWRALSDIPAGETRTYSQIAQAIGRPQAVRAAASACGANPLAVLVPCHRVIGSDGTLTGYRWGLERKRLLLAREGAVLSASGAATRHRVGV